MSENNNGSISCVIHMEDVNIHFKEFNSQIIYVLLLSTNEVVGRQCCQSCVSVCLSAHNGGPV